LPRGAVRSHAADRAASAPAAPVEPASHAAPAVIEGAALAFAAFLAVLAPGPASAFDLQGHRGARGLAPENTLAAFERALELGVDTLELDVGISRDDVAVVVHDRRLNPDVVRDAQGRWLDRPGPPIRALDLAAIRAHDVGRLRPGSAYAASQPAQRPVDGERIPTLAEVFELARRRGADRVRFNVETKLSPLAPAEAADPDTFARVLVDAIRAAGAAARTTVQSFDWRTLRRVRQLAPEIATVCLTSRQPRWTPSARTRRSPRRGPTACASPITAACRRWCGRRAAPPGRRARRTSTRTRSRGRRGSGSRSCPGRSTTRERCGG